MRQTVKLKVRKRKSSSNQQPEELAEEALPGWLSEDLLQELKVCAL